MQRAVENPFIELPLIWATHANCNCNQQANLLDTVVAYAQLHKSITSKLDMGVRAEENTFLISQGGTGHGYVLLDVECNYANKV